VTVPPAIGLRHVALRVRDLETVERFWVEVLGYRAVWRPDPDNVYLVCASDNVALHRAPADPGVGTLDHVGIVVPTAQAVDEWYAHLVAAGAPVSGPPKTHRDGTRSIYTADPEGTRIQIIHLVVPEPEKR
jgi:catechol 2,3-dioxygenase-like lactoylglutathione lyase family enzyme